MRSIFVVASSSVSAAAVAAMMILVSSSLCLAFVPSPSRSHRSFSAPPTTSSSKRRALASELRMSSSGSGVRQDGWYPGQNLINVDKERIAFDELYMSSSKDLVMYLPNLKLGRDCNQADAVLKDCIKKGRNFLSADYYAHGDSSGDILDATLSRWTEDVITMLVNVAKHVDEGGRTGKKAVLVGHAVGSWVATLVALKRPDLVRGIVGIGADPDFTEDLVWKSLPDADKQTILDSGSLEIEWGKLKETYMITKSLITDGRDNLILRGGRNSLPIDCPVRLIHDMDDTEVHCDTSIRLAECIKSDDVVVTIPKGVKGVADAIDQCLVATK